MYTTIFCSFPLPVLSSSAANSSGSSSMSCKKEYMDYATFDIQIFFGCLSISLMNTLHFPQHFSGVKKKKKKKTSAVFSLLNNISQGHWEGTETQKLLRSLQMACETLQCHFPNCSIITSSKMNPSELPDTDKLSFPSFFLQFY